MVGYRMIVWYLRGRKAYTSIGYQQAQKNFKQGDLDVDLKGRSFIVTGANSGVGFETAKEIAARGGKVHLVCRSEQRGSDAKKQIIQDTQNENLELHVVDMSSPKDIKGFVENLIQKEEPVHVLVNNAGCMVHERKITAEGLEFNFAVNSFGVYLMTTLLIPYMKKFEDPRVVTVTSGGMLLAKLDPVDPMLSKVKDFKGDEAYSQHKRQQVVMTEEWTKSHPEISFYSMHPGWSDTPAVRDALPDFYEKMKDDLRTTAEGADSEIWLSIAKNIPENCKGGFIQDREPVSKHLPLAWTKNSQQESQALMDWMKNKAIELGVLSK